MLSGFHEERPALLRRQARLHLPVWAAGYPGAACHILCDHPPWPDRFSDGGLPRCRLPRRLKPSALAGPALGSDRQLRPCRAHTLVGGDPNAVWERYQSIEGCDRIPRFRPWSRKSFGRP